MEKNLEDLLSDIEQINEKKEEKKKAGASLVYNSSSKEIRLKPKSGEFIIINYDDFSKFLKEKLNKNLSKSTIRKFTDDLRKFLNLYTENDLKNMEDKN